MLRVIKKKKKKKTTYTTYYRSRYCVVDDLMELVVFLNTHIPLYIFFSFFPVSITCETNTMNSNTKKWLVRHWWYIIHKYQKIYTTLCSNFIVRFFNRSIISLFYIYIYIYYISHTRLYFTIMAAMNLLF